MSDSSWDSSDNEELAVSASNFQIRIQRYNEWPENRATARPANRERARPANRARVSLANRARVSLANRERARQNNRPKAIPDRAKPYHIPSRSDRRGSNIFNTNNNGSSGYTNESSSMMNSSYGKFPGIRFLSTIGHIVFGNTFCSRIFNRVDDDFSEDADSFDSSDGEDYDEATGFSDDSDAFEFDFPIRGMSLKDIRLLPLRSFLSSSESPNDDNGRCNICHEFCENGDILRTLPCFHWFHQKCIDQWLVKEGVCPVCQRTVSVDSE